MKTSMLRPLLVAVACCFISGCAYLAEFLKSANSFLQPNFNFKSLSLTDINLGGLNLDTIWSLENKSNVGISLASVDYALFVEEKQLVAGAPPAGLQISPMGASDLHFPAGIKFIDLANVIETFLTKDTAAYRAEGGIGVQTPIGVIKFPIAKSGDFEVPKIPAVVFGNPKVSGVTLTGATIEFPLTVTNKNSFSLPINGLLGNIAVGNANIGQISTGDLGAMDGKGTRTVNLPLKVNFISAAGAVMQAINGSNAQLKFDAQLQSGPQAVPLNVNQIVSFVK